jgi:hypothetical protein
MEGFAVLVLVTIHFLLDRLVTDGTVEDFRNRFHGTTSRESFLTLSGVKTPEQGAFSPCPVSRHPHRPISRSNFFSLAFNASSLDSCPVPAGANRRAGNSVVDLRQLLCSRRRMLQARTRIMNQLQAVALNEGYAARGDCGGKRDAGRQPPGSFGLARWAGRRPQDLLELLGRLSPRTAELRSSNRAGGGEVSRGQAVIDPFRSRSADRSGVPDGPPTPIPGMHSGVEAAQKDDYAGK